jgi:hypothetical protein
VELPPSEGEKFSGVWSGLGGAGGAKAEPMWGIVASSTKGQLPLAGIKKADAGTSLALIGLKLMTLITTCPAWEGAAVRHKGAQFNRSESASMYRKRTMPS